MAEPDKYKNPSRNANGSAEVDSADLRMYIRQSLSYDYADNAERERVESRLAELERGIKPERLRKIYAEEREGLVRDGVLAPDSYSLIK